MICLSQMKTGDTAHGKFASVTRPFQLEHENETSFSLSKEKKQ